jgi:hypothetical protein
MPIDTTSSYEENLDTRADWDPGIESRCRRACSPPVQTLSQPFEHLEADILKLGTSKDRYGPRTGAAFRENLAKGVRTSDFPDRLIDLIVRHCCVRPNQIKIEDGADVLSRVPAQLCDFVAKDFDSYRGSDILFGNRVWLYTTALSWSSDETTRNRRIRLVESWLWDKDSTVREMAACALGEMRAIEARESLRAALGRERVSSVREVLSAAVEDAGESA